MRIETDRTRAFLDDTIAALESGRADAMLRVLEVKAVAAEAAIAVTDLAMKVCGGAAFRKELGVERRFRDARAARVMAPTTDALLDFVGRAICGLPLDSDPAMTGASLMGAVAYDPKVVTIWDGFRAWFRDQGLDFDYVLYSNYERQVDDLVAGRIHAAWNSPLAWVRTGAARARRPGPWSCATPTRTSRRWWWCGPTPTSRRWPTSPGGRWRWGRSTRPRPRSSPCRHLRAAGAAGRRRCAASTSASASTATTSAASGTRPGPWPRARSTPPA